MKTLIAASAIALTATSTLAGDWTGGYAGAGLGYADVNISGGISGGSGGTQVFTAAMTMISATGLSVVSWNMTG
jgi:hypothetical protein